MTKIKTSDIVLWWTCPTCNQKIVQALTNIVESGAAMCTDCDCGCELDDEVDVHDSSLD